MTKIETLVDDIYKVIQGEGGWNKTISTGMAMAVASSANNRFSKPQKSRGYLSLSSIGTPCKRKLWYKINSSGEGEPLQPNTLHKFFYGDRSEERILIMAEAAGHDVQGHRIG